VAAFVGFRIVAHAAAMPRLLLAEFADQERNCRVGPSRPTTRLELRGCRSDPVGSSSAGTAQEQKHGPRGGTRP
jgi:hypothetical protein